MENIEIIDRVEPSPESLKSPRILAFEGIGGSGKSHLISLLTTDLIRSNTSVTQFKISGLGDSPKVKTLKAISAHREEVIMNGTATEKILADKEKDKVFRLATAYQIRLFQQEINTTTPSDFTLLDRTPVMPWVYAASRNPSNPYLEEILDDGLKQTAKLQIDRLFFLNVPADVAYSRILARMLVSKSIKEIIDSANVICRDFIQAPDKVTKDIIELTLNQISTFPELQPKSSASWDFIPYSVMEAETINYLNVLEIMHQQLGLQYTILDAKSPIGELLEQLKECIISSEMGREMTN